MPSEIIEKEFQVNVVSCAIIFGQDCRYFI